MLLNVNQTPINVIKSIEFSILTSSLTKGLFGLLMSSEDASSDFGSIN